MLYLPRLGRLFVLAQLGVGGEGSGTGDVEVGQFAKERLEAGLFGRPVDLDADADEDCRSAPGWSAIGGSETGSERPTERQSAQVGSIAGNHEGQRSEMAILADVEGEILLEHRALVDEYAVDPL